MLRGERVAPSDLRGSVHVRLEGIIRVGKVGDAEGSIIGKSGRGTEYRHQSRSGTEAERRATCSKGKEGVIIKGNEFKSRIIKRTSRDVLLGGGNAKLGEEQILSSHRHVACRARRRDRRVQLVSEDRERNHLQRRRVMRSVIAPPFVP